MHPPTVQGTVLFMSFLVILANRCTGCAHRFGGFFSVFGLSKYGYRLGKDFIV